MFLRSPAASLLKVFWPLLTFQRTTFKRRHSGVANSTTCVYLCFAACYHYVQLLHCGKIVIFVVAERLRGLVYVLVFCLSSSLSLPPSPQAVKLLLETV